MPTFLKYGDIKGDSTNPAHPAWIELTSAEWGQGRAVDSQSGNRASPSVSKIVVTKASDSASLQLFSEAASGSPVSATIDFVRNDGSVYLRLEMSGALISGYSISGSGDNTSESLTLNFTKIEFKNTPGTPPP